MGTGGAKDVGGLMMKGAMTSTRLGWLRMVGTGGEVVVKRKPSVRAFLAPPNVYQLYICNLVFDRRLKAALKTNHE